MSNLGTYNKVLIVEAIENYVNDLTEAKRTWGTGEEDKDMGMFFDLKINDYIELIKLIKKAKITDLIK
tara:strand:+ start:520 stop:723 length:204 start_codon:yes stop_codon:yes gene_type:complete